MAIDVQENLRFRIGEDDTLGVDCRKGLRSKETITSVASVVSVPTGLTVASAQTNAGAVEIDGEQVPAGKALLCTVTGGVAGATYEIVFTLSTSHSPTPTVKTNGIKLTCYT